MQNHPAPTHTHTHPCVHMGDICINDYHIAVAVQGDPKQELCEFAESAAIDLLISGCSSGSRLRKALTGGSVSTHLTQRAPCPTLVIPQKYFAPHPEFAGALETASSAEPGSSPPEKGRPSGCPPLRHF